MTSPLTDPAAQAEAEFSATVELFNKLIKLPDVSKALGSDVAPHKRVVYTQVVTLWMLILQCLGKTVSLKEVVSQVVNRERHILPDNKRVREGTLSTDTGAYSKARKRLSLDVVFQFSEAVCNHLANTSPSIFENRRVFVLDGTTITFPPTPALQAHFTPASNQHGRSVWPVAMLMVAHEPQTGCAMLPQIDPMYGDNRSCEVKQAREIVKRLPANSIVMADANFGVFSAAYYSQAAGHDFLFRATRTRFKALVKDATLQDEGSNWKSYSLRWIASRWVLGNTLELPKDAALDVFIHEVRLPDGTNLCLISSLPITAQCAGELYWKRYSVEFDIRDIKVTMDAEHIAAKSVDMVLKELMTSVVAYNMVAQFRRQAAGLIRVEPRALSFTGVWLSFRDGLLRKEPATHEEWLANYTRALISASQQLLPKRKTVRSCPRKAHYRAPKTTKFQKSLRQQKKPPHPPPVT